MYEVFYSAEVGHNNMTQKPHEISRFRCPKMAYFRASHGHICDHNSWNTDNLNTNNESPEISRSIRHVATINLKVRVIAGKNWLTTPHGISSDQPQSLPRHGTRRRIAEMTSARVRPPGGPSLTYRPTMHVGGSAESFVRTCFAVPLNVVLSRGSLGAENAADSVRGNGTFVIPPSRQNNDFFTRMLLQVPIPTIAQGLYNFCFSLEIDNISAVFLALKTRGKFLRRNDRVFKCSHAVKTPIFFSTRIVSTGVYYQYLHWQETIFGFSVFISRKWKKRLLEWKTALLWIPKKGKHGFSTLT